MQANGYIYTVLIAKEINTKASKYYTYTVFKLRYHIIMAIKQDNVDYMNSNLYDRQYITSCKNKTHI